MNKPWERQPGETAKAYAAFLLYRDLSAIDRSVAAARERQERDRKGTLRQWNGWSMRNGWVNRAAEHDSDLASRRRERMAKELERAQDDAGRSYTLERGGLQRHGEARDKVLVLQRQFREGCGVMPAWRRGAWHGSVWPVRYCPAYPQATAATRLARTVPGAAFPAPPGRPAAS